tara:strand:+ start:31039 stop:31386 length:348 start_codon:yes stop_codon:yes gene_type:complete
MSSQLIFHIVSKRKWRECFQEGIYRLKSEDDSEQGSEIECVSIKYLNQYLNQHFKGRKNLFILVIDISRLARKPNLTEDQELIHIDNEIRSEAILDKIRIDCGKEGQFDLNVFSS